MKNKVWLRVISLVLASVCLISVLTAAAADAVVKTTLWDLQKAVNEGKTTAEKTAVLAALLGGGDELHPNAQGEYEIWSELGLRNMVKNAGAGYTFKLMKSIDLGGKQWPLVSSFRGTFDGGNFTISNFNITQASGTSIGFFAVVDNNGTDAEGNVIQSEVKNLKLENVTLTVPVDSEVRYAGMIAGNNRGIIMNCSVVGTINDARTTLSKAAYLGAIAGNNSTAAPGGKIYAVNGMTVRDTCTTYTHTQKVNSMLAVQTAELTEGSSSRNIGIVGYSNGSGLINSDNQKTGANSGLYWQDITNSTTLVSQTLQDRRAAVVDYMYQMCTVEWSPSVTMKYNVYKSGTEYTYATYTAGSTYKGIPYNHGSSGMDRFQAYLENPTYTEAYYFTDKGVVNALNNNTPDENGYVTVTAENYGTSTPNVNYVGQKVKVPVDWVKKTTGTIITGFGRYMGNDCSSAANWAWRRISANTGTGFAELRSTSQMIPTQYYMDKYGFLPVNGLTFDEPSDLDKSGSVGTTDYVLLVDAKFAADNQGFYRALAGTSKGDALVGFSNAGGHTRVAAGDAVTIYKVKGNGTGSEIDPKLSYVITHEQGRNSKGSGWSSNCTVNFKYTFDMLTNYSEYKGGSDSDAIGTRGTYYPITCAALRQEDTPAATAWCSMENGVITSNFHIVSTTVGSETVYTNTANLTGSRAPCVSVEVAKVHSATGTEVTVLLSNGETRTFPYGG